MKNANEHVDKTALTKRNREVIVETNEKIVRSGGGAVIRIPKNARKILRVGDSVKVTFEMFDNQARMEIIKELNFSLNDLQKLVKELNFKVKYEKKNPELEIFSAEREGGISIDYVNSIQDPMSIGYITITKKWFDVDLEKYKEIVKLAKNYNGLVRSEGEDLYVIELLKEPERYGLDMEGALKLLKENNWKAGFSLTLRFNILDNKITDIENVLKKLTSI
ncbi:MAG: hypothetical protein ACP5NL_06335 [Thermoplasmata archaeon]